MQLFALLNRTFFTVQQIAFKTCVYEGVMSGKNIICVASTSVLRVKLYFHSILNQSKKLENMRHLFFLLKVFFYDTVRVSLPAQ